MAVLFFILNAVISFFNAWSSGAMWDSTKMKGGFAHFLNWMVAIMAAIGFSWCLLILEGWVGTMVPASVLTEGAEGPLLQASDVLTLLELGYLVLVGPLLGSGLVMTIASWRAFARHRSIGGGLEAGYNTWAMARNTGDALYHVPKIAGGLGDKLSFDGDDAKGLVLIFLVIFALFGGVMITRWIMRAAARS